MACRPMAKMVAPVTCNAIAVAFGFDGAPTESPGNMDANRCESLFS